MLNCLLQWLDVSQSCHEIPTTIGFAIAFVAGALLFPFLENKTIFQHESTAIGKAFQGGCSGLVLIIFVQYTLQVLVSGAAGFYVVQVLLQGGEDVFREDGFGHERQQQRGELFLSFRAVR